MKSFSLLPLLSLLLLSGLPAGPPTTASVPDSSTTRPSRKVEVTLTASVARMELVPGRTTEVYAYNGSVPGPTLGFMEGDEVIVHFRNDLPVETTVHWHGLHLPFTSDGSPFHPVAPGGTYEYRFTVRSGAAGTYWYHPHPNHATGVQVARGLYGGIIVRAADDPLPRGLTERLLILSDNRFLPDGSFDLPELHTPPGRIDFENGREGSHLFVSGTEMPTYDIRPGEVQRWRIINASAGRYYRLAIPGQKLVQVGTDGGLFEKPVEVDEILLAVAERVELLVTGGPAGTTVAMQNLPYDRYIPQTRPPDWDAPRNILTLRSGGAPAVPVAIPATLRHVPRIDPATATATHEIVLSQGFINGKQMDMNRVDVSSVVGATEIWQVENIVGMDHPFHLHGVQFQVIERNGVPEPFPAWKDLVNVPKRSMVRFVVRYLNYPGKWMFHCHILDHEDHGMMGILEIR